MTQKQVDALVRCPECYGHGHFKTPSQNWKYKFATCDRCDGKGYISEMETSRDCVSEDDRK